MRTRRSPCPNPSGSLKIRSGIPFGKIFFLFARLQDMFCLRVYASSLLCNQGIVRYRNVNLQAFVNRNPLTMLTPNNEDSPVDEFTVVVQTSSIKTTLLEDSLISWSEREPKSRPKHLWFNVAMLYHPSMKNNIVQRVVKPLSDASLNVGDHVVFCSLITHRKGRANCQAIIHLVHRYWLTLRNHLHPCSSNVSRKYLRTIRGLELVHHTLSHIILPDMGSIHTCRRNPKRSHLSCWSIHQNSLTPSE